MPTQNFFFFFLNSQKFDDIQIVMINNLTTYRHHKSEAPQASAKPQRNFFLKNDLKRALKQK
jgi:hypothetical protein